MNASTGSLPIRKGFVDVPSGQVHYRAAGYGPPVVLLHDSPRSSVMHTGMLQALAGEFTAIAIDTPGYGHSTPLPAEPVPTIPDYARALAATLEAFGIARCPVYGFHTSSKINLQFAVDHPDRVSLAILDGLSLPPGGPGEDFIARYMKPYVVLEDGSHLASSWARGRDLFRFFPWFDTRPQARLPLDQPDEKFLHRYVLDMLLSGPHYSAAYAAAMRYLALPQVERVRARTVFMCRDNDPLYPYLDALPRELPPGCSIERLPGDRDTWAERVIALLREGSVGAEGVAPSGISLPDPLARPRPRETRGYVSLPHGQLHLRRFGTGLGARPVLLLHECPGSSAGVRDLAAALGADRTVYALDLPGVGESDPLPTPDVAHYAAALRQLLDVLGLAQVDVVAEFTSVPFAVELARTAANRVHALGLDGTWLPGAAERRALWRQYCPPLAPRTDGTHLLSLWHRIRDQELSWPWFERSAAGIRRRAAPIDGQRLTAIVTDLALQPSSYGDAALAALEHDLKPALDAVAQPVLLLEDAADVRYQWTARVARRLGRASRVPRAPDAAERAVALRQWFDAPSVRRAGP
ncbi:MAG: alpha/beta hydrolase [Steroidobacteraceae bacterium]|jgi:pimeloyl-ACP methyl ester carboxylesterase|nr:alpha/beta hydrolase [Steroidobacteraceae bacterium]